MTATLIRVDSEAYEAACGVVGDGVGTSVDGSATALLDALDGSAGMAGSDSSGAAWAEGYDVAANFVLEATTDLVNASYRLAALLQQTGFNYGRAEMASVPGGTVRTAPDLSGYGERVCRLPHPPSARGWSAVGTPPGWSLVQHAVGYLWPNGHQDRLHAAADAWQAYADRLDATADYLPRASASIADCAGPETGDAERACASVRAQVLTLADGVRTLAAACTDYAHHLDEAHSAVEHELTSLVEWTVVIEGTGALCSLITFGGSEAVAQGAEASRIAATAARIAALLARLGALARASAVAVANAGYRVAGIATELRPLLTSRLVVALADGAEPLRIAESAAAASETRLAAVARARKRLRLIDDPKHFDPQSLRGMSIEDVEAGLPEEWVADATRSGNGTRYADPVRRDRQIRVMPGYEPGARPGAINAGPYAVVAQNGVKVKIPLAGNPTLR